MQRLNWRLSIGLLLVAGCAAPTASLPQAVTWREIQERFRANDPTLLAGKVAIDESRADEVTAYLRPNPDFTLSADGTQITPYRGVWQPFAGTFVSTSVSYLHEREHKRELRLASAQQATAIAVSSQADLERTLMFNLRDAFVRVLQAKAVLGVAQENLEYYDKEISINRDRYQAGSLAKVDFQRVELQRIQFESDLATAQVNLRTARIDLLALLRDPTPVNEFDLREEFDFTEPEVTLPQLRAEALQTRPDLKEAEQTVEKARTDHELAIANGSTIQPSPPGGPTMGHSTTRLLITRLA
ncbi:MAG: TolC family protein [Acidobacteriaceae bacterium]|nr:TolC family protein [Acidobacteriaceae bacterium]